MASHCSIAFSIFASPGAVLPTKTTETVTGAVVLIWLAFQRLLKQCQECVTSHYSLLLFTF